MAINCGEDVENAEKELNTELDNIKKFVSEQELQNMEQCQYENLTVQNEEKIRMVHDYLVTKLEYDDKQSQIYEVYGAIIKNRAVCEGYAKAYKYILDNLDIPCIIVCGEAVRENATIYHAWNYVKLDNEWYAVDVTWDDVVENSIKYKYYLKGSDRFFVEHKENCDTISKKWKFIYPLISKTDLL